LSILLGAARAAARAGPRPAPGGTARALRSSSAMARAWGCDLGRAVAPGNDGARFPPWFFTFAAERAAAPH
jgi:hypothetical protein